MHMTYNAKIMFLRNLQIARTVSGKCNLCSITNSGFCLGGGKGALREWLLMFSLSPWYMKLQALSWWQEYGLWSQTA